MRKRRSLNARFAGWAESLLSYAVSHYITKRRIIAFKTNWEIMTQESSAKNSETAPAAPESQAMKQSTADSL